MSTDPILRRIVSITAAGGIETMEALTQNSRYEFGPKRAQKQGGAS